MTIINKKYDSNNGEPSSNLNQNKDSFEEKIWNALRVSNKLDAGHNTEVNRLGRKVSDTQKLLVEMHNNIVDSTHQEITKAADVFVGETELTLIPNFPKSIAKDFVKPSTPNFVIQ